MADTPFTTPTDTQERPTEADAPKVPESAGGQETEAPPLPQGRPGRAEFVPTPLPEAPAQAPELERRFRESEARQDALIQHLPASPAPPALQVKFPDPPKFVPVTLAQAFGSSAVAFGVLASLFTRRPLINALTAAGSAMKGIQDGNLEHYDKDVQTWKQETETALQRNKSLMEEYNLANDKYKNDFQRVMAEWKAIAAKNQDEIQLANLRRQDWEAAYKRVEDGNKAGIELQKHYDALEDHFIDPKRAAARLFFQELGHPPTEADVLRFEKDWAESSRSGGSRSAVSERFQQQVNRSTGQALRSIEMTLDMGLDQNVGMANAVRSDGHLLGNATQAFVRKITPENKALIQVSLAGLTTELGYILNGGRPPTAEIQQALQARFTLLPGDTYFSAAYKMADAVNIMLTSLQTSEDFTPKQREDRLAMIEKLKQYRTPEEIYRVFREAPSQRSMELMHKGQPANVPGARSEYRTPRKPEEYTSAEEVRQDVAAGIIDRAAGLKILRERFGYH